LFIHHSAVLTIVTSSEEVIWLHQSLICNQNPEFTNMSVTGLCKTAVASRLDQLCKSSGEL